MSELERGAVVVWTLKIYKATAGLSPAHRVLEKGQTYCLERIPPPDRLVPTDMLRVPPCERCEHFFTIGATPSEIHAALVREVMHGTAA